MINLPKVRRANTSSTFGRFAGYSCPDDPRRDADHRSGVGRQQHPAPTLERRSEKEVWLVDSILLSIVYVKQNELFPKVFLRCMVLQERRQPQALYLSRYDYPL